MQTVASRRSRLHFHATPAASRRFGVIGGSTPDPPGHYRPGSACCLIKNTTSGNHKKIQSTIIGGLDLFRFKKHATSAQHQLLPAAIVDPCPSLTLLHQIQEELHQWVCANLPPDESKGLNSQYMAQHATRHEVAIFLADVMHYAVIRKENVINRPSEMGEKSW